MHNTPTWTKVRFKSVVRGDEPWGNSLRNARSALLHSKINEMNLISASSCYFLI
jgi:hypothetical protein